ncbi:MAG TPA: pitrilysin family protein [Gammaproteobacteria bacterium]|nr:pitrilysin family protein [Gammaproteobacteria bacterium]
MNLAHSSRRARLARRSLVILATAVFAAVAVPAVAASMQGGADSGVVRATLSNGLQVVIVPNHLAPVVTTVMNYKVGSNEAPRGFPGTAHAQEHMMFRGSPGLSAAQLSAISAAMGGDFNADTQQSVTQYFFTVPKQYLGVALHIQSTRMRGVLDEESLWKKERGAIEQEVARDLSQPEYRAYKKVLARMFAGTPYAHDALGTRPSFDKTNGAMLHHFYDQWYAPNNAILVVTGDVDPAAAMKEIRSQFGDIRAKKLPQRPQFKLQPVKPSTIKSKIDQPYGLVLVAFRMPGYARPKEYAALQVLSQALSNQRGKLYSDLVPTGRALDAGFDTQGMQPASLGFAVAAFPRGADPHKLLGELRGILSHTAKHGVPADLVKAAKRHVLTQAEAQKNSISGQAMQWSQSLAVEGRRSPEEEIHAIEQVTPADVNRVAHEYLDQKHAIVALLSPQGSGKPTASGGGFGGKESFKPSHVSHVKLPGWAAKPLASISVPESTVRPTVYTYPNGLRLIVQPESISHTISVYGRIHNRPELTVPKGQEGVDQVLGQLLQYGTHSMNRVRFRKALDDIGASESAGTDFSLQVLSGHLERGMQLLAANELQPRLPQKAFKVVRRQVAGEAAGRIHSPDFKMQQALRAALYPAGDPTLRHATPASVRGLTLKDVQAYYHKVFRPDLTTIVVIGDITPAKARQMVGRYFGDWKAHGPKPPVELPSVPSNKPQTVNVPDPSRVQDQVVMAETLGLTRTDPAYYALTLGNQVLSGGFYASRLYHDLREERGLVYTVHSDIDANRTRGHLVVGFGADPDKVQPARRIIVHDLAAMAHSPVHESELHRAKAELVRQIPLSESSVDSIADGLLSRSTEGLPLDEPIRAALHYLSLDATGVQKAFRKYVRPSDLVMVSKGPAPGGH